MKDKHDNHLIAMGMAAAAGLLVMLAVFISSGFAIPRSISNTFALLDTIAPGTNSAAVAYWPTYDGGYPNPLNDDTVYAQDSGAKYGCGAHYCWQSNFCSNPYIGALSAKGAGGQNAATRVQSNGAVSSAGTTAGVNSGDSVTLDWACQPYRTINYIDGSQKCTKYAGSATNSYANNSTVTGPAGTVYSGSNLIGSASVTLTGAPGSVSTYSLECKGQGSWKTTVSVRILTPPPTVGITGNGTSGTVSVDVGEPVAVKATFAPSEGDALEKTAINDNNSNLLAGVTWMPPTDKAYVFTPTAPGSYIFYPAVQTTNYPGWNNYGKSLTVNASLNCKANAHAEGNACVCNTFYQLEGGACSITCPPNSSEQGGTCACDPGFNVAGASCILFDFCLNVPGTQTSAPANSARQPSGNCGCDAGYQLVGDQCMLAAVLKIQVNGQQSVRVRSGTNTIITWSASNVTLDTCFIRDAGQSSIGSGAANPIPAPARVAAHENTYTLTCTDLNGQQKSASATVKIIPSLEEI